MFVSLVEANVLFSDIIFWLAAEEERVEDNPVTRIQLENPPSKFHISLNVNGAVFL